jgi:DHA1 family bicyclomycin/chloramphenicol resistance-like MFS transporter
MWIILLLGALCVVTPFAIDMYLPAFSNVAAEFKTTTAEISLSLSIYFVGFALGQVLYGPLLDRLGRKRPLYVGLTIYILCSIGCAVAPNLRIFVALRFLEALGG